MKKMLLIWSESKSSDVYSALGPVLKNHTDLEVEVVSDYSGVPNKGATAVLCLGPAPLETMQAAGVVPKGRKTSSVRTVPFTLPDGDKALFSYSPGVIKANYSYYVDLLCDASAAVRMAKTGQVEPIYGEYKYVENFAQFRAEVEAKYAETGKPVDVAADTETIGLDPYFLGDGLKRPPARLVCIQLSHTPGTSQVVYFLNHGSEVEYLHDWDRAAELDWILTTPKISMKGANLKYDLHWLWVRGSFICTNFKMDTTLVGSTLDENRSNGLDIHVKVYAPELGGYSDKFDRSVDKSRMDLVPKQDMLLYAGGDADGTLRVSEVMKRELKADPKLARFYINILHPAARAFEMVEQGGVYVDPKAYKKLEHELQAEIAYLVEKSKSLLGGRIVAKHADPDKPGGMNLTKASLLKDFMFSPMGLNLKPQMVTAKEKEPSTAMEHLMKFADVPEAKEFVSLLSDYASATKTLSTYVLGFQKHIRSDGRYHPTYFFMSKGGDDGGEGSGTVTGRLSARDPAFQTLPKHTKWAKKLRKCFPAPPGMVVMERDFSQGELKVIACIANEVNMINAYKKGLDLHVVTSGNFAGYSYDEMMVLKKEQEAVFDAIRQLGKAGNFGLIYGMGVDGFYMYAVSNYGVKGLTLEKAAEFRTGFFDTYPGLVSYHKWSKNSAKENGWVRGPLGRLRHLPLIDSPFSDVRSKAERQAINSPVQGTLSDMLLWSIALERAAGLADTCPCFGAIHDAVYNYVPEDKAEEYAVQHLDIMQNLPFNKLDWEPQLFFNADAKLGPNMAQLKKFEPLPF